MSKTSNRVTKPCRQNKPKSAAASKLRGTSSTSVKTMRPKLGKSARQHSAHGSKASANPAASPSARSKKSSAKPGPETIRVTVSNNGEVLDSSKWPVSLWRAAQKRAKALGLTMDQYVNQMVQADLAPQSVVLTPKNLARAQAMADMLEFSLAEWVNRTVGNFLNDVYDCGRVYEIEVDRYLVFDSRAEALRISRRVLEFDRSRSRNRNFAPRVFKDSDGDWMATYPREEAE